MSETHWLRRRWKLVLNIITFVALLILIFAIHNQIGATISNLRHVHAWALLLLIPAEALNYHAQARLYQRLFAIVGNKVSYRFLYETSVELNFVNHVFPSGGVSGISYFTLRTRKGSEISSGKATLVHIMKIALYFLSFELVLVFGLFCLAVMGRVNGIVILVASSLSTLLLVGTVLFAYIVGSRERINSFFTGATKALNRLIQLVRPKSPETISIVRARGMFDEFHDSYIQIQRSYAQLKLPFVYALIADLTELFAVYSMYIAFGKFVNVGAVILAYGIANFAGLVSVAPGGVGVYEFLMTGVLAASGVPPGVSLPATIMYRVLNSLLQLTPGYYLYERALKQAKHLSNLGKDAV
jgi:putative heme transporter